MRGAVLPLPQYAFMAWCLVKKAQGQLYIVGSVRVTHMGEIICAYKILVGKPERKRELGIPRRTSGDNIRMDLREIGRGKLWTGCIWLRTGTSGGLL
jgi:hypothetical protein